MLLLMGFSASFAAPWAVSPSKHQRVERQPPGVRSSCPAVYIDVSSLSQTLESIRSELTEIFRPSIGAASSRSLEQQRRNMYLHI